MALGGTGYAAIKLPANSVTSIQVKDRSLLGKDFKAGQLPAGPRGPQVPQAPPLQGGGRSCCRTARSSPSPGGSPPARPGDGYYVLDFGSAVTGKLIFATPARSSEDRNAPGGIQAGPCVTTQDGDNCATGNDPRFVAVYTFDAGSALHVDHAFYVGVSG